MVTRKREPVLMVIANCSLFKVDRPGNNLALNIVSESLATFISQMEAAITRPDLIPRTAQIYDKVETLIGDNFWQGEKGTFSAIICCVLAVICPSQATCASASILHVGQKPKKSIESLLFIYAVRVSNIYDAITSRVSLIYS